MNHCAPRLFLNWDSKMREMTHPVLVEGGVGVLELLREVGLHRAPLWASPAVGRVAALLPVPARRPLRAKTLLHHRETCSSASVRDTCACMQHLLPMPRRRKKTVARTYTIISVSR
jgi:hypothetical protein